MTSEPLLTSLVFFAALLAFSATLRRYRLRRMIWTGIVVFCAAALSSLSLDYGTLLTDGVDGTAEWLGQILLRFALFALVLALGNRRGLWDEALLQTLWLWALLEMVFIGRFGAVPSLSDYMLDYMPIYLVMPTLVAFLTRRTPRRATRFENVGDEV